MNGRGKSVRLCVVFTLSGLLTILCLARSSIAIPPGISQYLDIMMAVLMVVLLLCVLELCLGVELCGGVCNRHHGRPWDAEGQGDSDPPTPEPNEAPPSYDAIMAQGGAETHTGTAEGGRGRGRERESVPLKRDFSFHYKSPASDEEVLPPVRPPLSPGVSETSCMSPGELWLAVDGLPTYEEAVARLQEEEEEEAAATVQEGETGTVNQQEREAGVRQQEEEAMTERIPEDGEAGQQEEQDVGWAAGGGEKVNQEEEAMAALQEREAETVTQQQKEGASHQAEDMAERVSEEQKRVRDEGATAGLQEERTTR